MTQPGRLTDLAPGGGCSCKIGAGALESLLAQAFGTIGGPAGATNGGPVGAPTAVADAELLCGLEWGDDAAVVSIDGERAVVATTDFFPPVVDDPFSWGRIAAANALSDVYAMGAEPLVALNLLAWPTVRLTGDAVAEVLRGGRSATDEAGCFLAGGHSIEADTPTYGLAVTGIAHRDRLMRNDAARPGDPITLTKPLGVGVLNNVHKRTGAPIEEAVATMAALNRDAARAAGAAGIRAATDVTGFGLLGHLHKMARASGCTAVVDADAVPVLAHAAGALADGFVPGGTRRNLDWVRPFLDSRVGEDRLLLLADAQTSGGLLLAGTIPGAPVIGRFEARRGEETLVVR